MRYLFQPIFHKDPHDMSRISRNPSQAVRGHEALQRRHAGGHGGKRPSRDAMSYQNYRILDFKLTILCIISIRNSGCCGNMWKRRICTHQCHHVRRELCETWIAFSCFLEDLEVFRIKHITWLNRPLPIRHMRITSSHSVSYVNNIRRNNKLVHWHSGHGWFPNQPGRC